MKYQEIGQQPGDSAWLMIGEKLHVLDAGCLSDEDFSSWGHPDVALLQCWHGRYDHLSWQCSIVPSEECQCLTEPPDGLIDKLREHFEAISAFYYFGGGKDDVQPMEFAE